MHLVHVDVKGLHARAVRWPLRIRIEMRIVRACETWKPRLSQVRDKQSNHELTDPVFPARNEDLRELRTPECKAKISNKSVVHQRTVFKLALCRAVVTVVPSASTWADSVHPSHPALADLPFLPISAPVQPHAAAPLTQHTSRKAATCDVSIIWKYTTLHSLLLCSRSGTSSSHRLVECILFVLVLFFTAARIRSFVVRVTNDITR